MRGQLRHDPNHHRRSNISGSIEPDDPGAAVRARPAERGTLLDPNATTEQKAQAQAQLSALNGGQNAKDRYMTVGGGTRVVDGQTVKDPVSVFDTQTKTWIDQPGQGAAASHQAPLANPSTRPVGTISTVNGKTATWDGKQWVPRA